jgi:hypothetical protein
MWRKEKSFLQAQWWSRGSFDRPLPWTREKLWRAVLWNVAHGHKDERIDPAIFEADCERLGL